MRVLLRNDVSVRGLMENELVNFQTFDLPASTETFKAIEAIKESSKGKAQSIHFFSTYLQGTPKHDPCQNCGAQNVPMRYGEFCSMCSMVHRLLDKWPDKTYHTMVVANNKLYVMSRSYILDIDERLAAVGTRNLN